MIWSGLAVRVLHAGRWRLGSRVNRVRDAVGLSCGSLVLKLMMQCNGFCTDCAFIILAEILATPVSAALITVSPWIPYLLGLAFVALGIPIACFMPKTLDTSTRVRERQQRDPHHRQTVAPNRAAQTFNTLSQDGKYPSGIGVLGYWIKFAVQNLHIETTLKDRRMPQVNGILSITGFVFTVLAATTGLYLWTHIALTRVCFRRNYA